MTTKLSHLEQTFAEAERLHPDLMEPYACRLSDAEGSDERRAIMRMGLRETFRQRYPMPAGCAWPGEAVPIEAGS